MEAVNIVNTEVATIGPRIYIRIKSDPQLIEMKETVLI